MTFLKNKYLILAIVAIILIVGGVFGWMKYKAIKNSPENQNKQAEDAKIRILNNLKGLTDIPNEDPAMFTVSDANLLKSQQAFFKDTENGDILLVFQKAGKAYIYRESGNKIVNAGPISFQQQPKENTQPQKTPEKTEVKPTTKTTNQK